MFHLTSMPTMYSLTMNQLVGSQPYKRVNQMVSLLSGAVL